MIAIQLASILAMARSAELYGTTNLNQLAENISVSEIVSIGAMVVYITLGFWLVHTTNMKPWYTLLRSTITIFLSIATSHMSNHWPAFSIARWFEFARRNSGLHECGNRPPPLVWCARRYNGESSVAEI